MRQLATAIALLFVVAGSADAQSEIKPQTFTITGLVVAPHTDFRDEFEIRVTNSADVVVARMRSRTQQQFTFRGLEGGEYYVEMDVAGFEKVRERVDLGVGFSEINLGLSLDSQEEIVPRKPANLIGAEIVISAADLAPAAGIVKGFQEGNKKLQDGDIGGAQSRFESIVKEAPKFYDGHKALGVTYQQSHRYPEAEKEYQIARELRPLSAAPLILLGSLYLERFGAGLNESVAAQAFLDNAQTVLLRAVELSPDAAFARYLLGVTYCKLERYNEAEKNLLLALDLEPRLGEARLALSNVYTRIQDWTRSVVQLDRFLKENPRVSNRDRILETRRQIEQFANSRQSAILP